MPSKKIVSIEMLKEECAKGVEDYFISLAGGLARSSKNISWNSDDKEFEVEHEIDGSFERILEEELAKTNIGEALKVGALFSY